MKTLTKIRKVTLIAFISVVSLFQLTSCNFLQDELGLSMDRVVEGLKRALNIGTDEASSALSATDGFYMDAAAKIFLPDEAQVILAKKDNEIFKSLGITAQLDTEIEKVLLNINRSAEDASKEVAPIFGNAITNLSIAEGFDILNGKVPGADTATLKSSPDFDSTAATTYLQLQTLSALTGVFAPKINVSLDKPLVSGISANSAWSNLQQIYNGGVDKYNSVIDYQDKVNSLTGGLDVFGKQNLKLGLPTLPFSLPGITNVMDLDLGEKMTKMSVNLSEHCTGKALSAVFGKIKIKEKEIRKDPFAFGDDLLEEVFGSIFEE